MTSLLTADLPSEDEDDKDFNPDAEEDSKPSSSKRAWIPEPSAPRPLQTAAKRAKVDAVWKLLNKQQPGQRLPQKRSAENATSANGHGQVSLMQQQARPAPPAEHQDNTPATGGPQTQTSRALAAARAAAAGIADQASQVTVTRQFAGKKIEICVEDGSKDTAAKAAKQKSSLDAVLSSLQATKKVNVLDKSRVDWTAFKRSDKSANDELTAHANSNQKYLDKIDFLKRAELNEYEQETAARLKGDIRLRGQA